MRKRIMAIVCVLALCFSMVGCGAKKKDSKDTSSSTTEELKTIKVAGNPFIGAAPLYVAEAKGMFEKHGLKVEDVQFDDTSQSVSALIAGKVDVCGGTLDAIMIAADQSASDKIPVAFYVQDDSEGADGIVAVNGINTVADLKGKKIGVDINQTSHMLLSHALAENGMTDEDVTLIDMSSSDAGSSFIAGSLDAAVTWEPYLSNAANSGVGSMIYSSADAPGLIMDVLCISRSVAESDDNEWVVEFVAALAEAQDYINDPATKDDAFKIIGEYLGIDAAEAELEWSTVKSYTPAESAAALSAGGNGYDVVDIINDFYTGKGTMDNPVDASVLFDPSFAEKVK